MSVREKWGEKNKQTLKYPQESSGELQTHGLTLLRDGTSSPFHLGAFSSLKKSYWHWAACMAFQLSQGTAPIPYCFIHAGAQGPQARRASHSHTTSQSKAGAPPHGQSSELEPPWHPWLAARARGCYACASVCAILCYANSRLLC